MTAQEHPGIVALKARISDTQRRADFWSTYDQHQTVERLEREMTVLSERIEFARRMLAESAARKSELQAEADKLRNTLKLAESDDRVAQAVWLKLIISRAK